MQKFLIPLLSQFLVTLAQGRTVHEKREESYVWKILDLTRDVIPEENRVEMSMFILDGSPQGVYCMVNATAPPNTDLKTWGFANLDCLDNDWSVHWGYQSANDAGIMTVVSPEKDRDAFFGFNNINSGEQLGNAGPSQVQSCKCG
ncbi:hypothetical protein F4781DRAFT_437070 [Annulohypoxylon bovei var. microspora]|nr:hypothetical protein F4781DRAFT_437070 [Annulohypoxylon bovei var. microspora]